MVRIIEYLKASASRVRMIETSLSSAAALTCPSSKSGFEFRRGPHLPVFKIGLV